MRRAVLLLVLAACKKPPAPAPAAQASAEPVALASASASTSATGSVAVAPSASAPKSLPPLPVATEAFELVAVGKGWGSRILWLQEAGRAVWLSGNGLDALAEGDGPLAQIPDPLAKLPYKPGIHRLQTVGAWPKLFVLRTKNVNGRLESPDPTVFLRGEDGSFRQAKPVGIGWYPHAFVAYRDGAMLVTGQIQINAAPYYSESEPGTRLIHVNAAGEVSDPKLDVPRAFMAWDASAGGDTLSLLGTIGVAKKDDMEVGKGIYLLRLRPSGKALIPIQKSNENGMESYFVHVVEHGGRALVTAPPSLTAEGTMGWKPSIRTAFFVDAADKVHARTVPGDENCKLVKAGFFGDVALFRRDCLGSEAFVRVDADGKAARIALPSLAKKEGGGFRVAKEKESGLACMPVRFVAREPDDLWIQARCGATDDDAAAVPAVFRRGHAQEPIVLP